MKKKSPPMKGAHLYDDSISNISTIFPWVGTYGRDVDWHYSVTANFINDIAENCPQDSLKSVFIIPSQFNTSNEILEYLKKRTSFILDSLSCYDVSVLSPITENDFLKFTSHFFRRNNEIKFYDSISSNKSFRFTNTTNYNLGPKVNLKLHGAETDGFDRKIIINDNTFSVLYKNNDIFYDRSGVSHSFATDFAKFGDAPYLNLLITIHSNAYNLNDNSIVDIDITPPDMGSLYEIKEVYPTPTSLSLNRVKYIGKEAVENIIREGGVYIAAEDVKLAYRKDKMFMLTSVLLGTIIAFALEIIIQLIYKWRRLQP